ncbi:hypothetical protein BDF22DRAFT_691183 [Syncephalis plumigaleata]|nr:hypothetical protein BDF22DRAFT_691183 [Syncephalis plumigaleata]
MSDTEVFDIVDHFTRKLAADADVAVPVAVIEALVEYVNRSQATTMSELTLLRSQPESLPLEAGCALFKQFFAVTTEHIQDLEKGKQLLLERGCRFVNKASACRQVIAKLGARFIQDDMTILVHSYSRVVLELIRHAAQLGVNFRVLVTEARPTCSGVVTARALQELGVPYQLVADAAVASAMEEVDLVLLGGEAVTENGGLVSQIGTYQVALGAKAAGKLCYAVAESYKFVRRLPLNQRDLPGNAFTALRLEQDSVTTTVTAVKEHDTEMEWLRPRVDYTPASYINLFITDLGILTPAGVGDEVFRIYA